MGDICFHKNTVKRFRDMCLDNFLHQVVDENTRGNNILDLVLTSHFNLVSDISILEPLAGSDHNIVTFNLNTNISTAAKAKQKLCFNRADFNSMRIALQTVSWDIELGQRSVHESWEFFTKHMNSAIDDYVPRKPLRKKKHPHWFNNNIKVQLSRKRAAWKMYKCAPSHKNFIEYKQLDANLRGSIKASKADNESRITQDVKNNPKQFYLYVSNKEPSNIASIVQNGVLCFNIHPGRSSNFS